jgi:hypothetical protein
VTGQYFTRGPAQTHIPAVQVPRPQPRLQVPQLYLSAARSLQVYADGPSLQLACPSGHGQGAAPPHNCGSQEARLSENAEASRIDERRTWLSDTYPKWTQPVWSIPSLVVRAENAYWSRSIGRAAVLTDPLKVNLSLPSWQPLSRSRRSGPRGPRAAARRAKPRIGVGKPVGASWALCLGAPGGAGCGKRGLTESQQSSHMLLFTITYMYWRTEAGGLLADAATQKGGR